MEKPHVGGQIRFHVVSELTHSLGLLPQLLDALGHQGPLRSRCFAELVREVTHAGARYVD